MDNYRKLTEEGLTAMLGSTVSAGIIKGHIPSYLAELYIDLFASIYRTMTGLTEKNVETYNALGEDDIMIEKITGLFMTDEENKENGEVD